VPKEELCAKINYFLGSNPRRWHTNMPTYRKVEDWPLHGKRKDEPQSKDLVFRGDLHSLTWRGRATPDAGFSRNALHQTRRTELIVAQLGRVYLFCLAVSCDLRTPRKLGWLLGLSHTKFRDGVIRQHRCR
jgi:hypothetical protein